MINPYGVMALGFLISGVAAAITDFRWRNVNDAEWIPAILGLVWFYHYFPSLEFLLAASIFPILSLLVYWGANKAFKQKVGQADFIALGLVSFWPALGVMSIVGALAVAFVGRRLKRRGFPEGLWVHGIPFAGLIGAATAFVTAVYLIG